jgi:hypothetical protein
MPTNETVRDPKNGVKPQYETPKVKVMDEAEVLTAFQVTAAGATMWWTS